MSFFPAPPDLVAKNYPQHVWFQPTEAPGMFGLGALGDAASNLNDAIRKLEKAVKTSVDGYVGGYDVPMGFVNIYNAASDVQSLLYKKGIPTAGGWRDRAHKAAERIFEDAWDGVKKDKTAVEKVRRVGEMVPDMDELAAYAERLTGYKRIESITPTLYAFYAKNMELAAKNMIWMAGRIEGDPTAWIQRLGTVSSKAQWTKWYKDWMYHVDAYLLPIPPTVPGWNRVFSSYRSIMKRAGDVAQSFADPGVAGRMLAALREGILGLANMVDDAGKALWQWLKENFPNVVAALTWLPWVGLGVAGVVLYSYFMAPKRLVTARA